MTLYFTFDLDALARRNLYLDRVENAVLIRQISCAIEAFRYGLPATREPRTIPD